MIFIACACTGETFKTQFSPVEEKTVINVNQEAKGPEINLELIRGEAYYYPLMAFWIEDDSGRYIQTLYVPISVAKGVFKYGKQEGRTWKPSVKRAPQSLPYWSHKRGIVASDGLYMPEPENPVTDAYSGATPERSFLLNTKADHELTGVKRILFEINQNWDWNEYWTNDKYPEDEYYKSSCQPALVYEAVVDFDDPRESYVMKPIGHSHYSGETGELFTDLRTLTTALHIADSIKVTVKRSAE